MLLWAVVLARPVQSESPGVVSEQPASGIFVKVGERYMVPYQARIPGTDVTFEMVPVPGGTYLMGSPEDEADRQSDEGPQIEVEVPPMWVGKYEVRWDAYFEFMELYHVFTEFHASQIRKVDSPSRADAITAPTPLYKPSHTFEWGDDPAQPAVTMTQYAAMQFTEWLSAISGQQYRLPTEAEWEYACRAGTTTGYSWGDDPEAADDYAWFYDNAEHGQVPGGEKQANAFGLYDMHGNVAEWTVNAYTEDGYAWLKKLKQPVKAIEAVKWPESASGCVLRGGTWESDPENLRSAARIVSDDPAWKEKDPNFPKSPWWFSNDPSRGMGFRLFRSYETLDDKTIRKFWDHIAADAADDVASRIKSKKNRYGLVDDQLPAAMEEHL